MRLDDRGSGRRRRRRVEASAHFEQRLHDLLGDRRGDRAARSRCERSTVTATATCGSSAGAKRDEPGLVDVLRRCSISAVPVLPATSMPCSAAAVPVPSLDHVVIIAVDLRRRSRRVITRGSLRARCGRRCGRPGRRRGRRGAARISSPPLATAAATIAICSGVTCSLSWPIAMRPTSTRALVGGSSAAVAVLAAGAPSASAGSRSAGSASKPKRPMYSAIVALAELLADLRPHGVDRVRQRGREVDRRRSSRRRSCAAARRRSSSPFSPLTSRVGRELPAVDRRRRGDDLERRARRVAGLRRAVEQRRVGSSCRAARARGAASAFGS